MKKTPIEISIDTLFEIPISRKSIQPIHPKLSTKVAHELLLHEYVLGLPCFYTKKSVYERFFGKNLKKNIFVFTCRFTSYLYKL